jgi:predicted small lipoprotein YifL
MQGRSHRQLIRVLVLLLGSSVLATACGQKGPLYLPGEKPVKPKPQVVQTTQETKKEGDKTEGQKTEEPKKEETK